MNRCYSVGQFHTKTIRRKKVTWGWYKLLVNDAKDLMDHGGMIFCCFRAITHITGFVLRSRSPEGCVLNYVAQCDPQGKLPPWLVNKVTHTLGPRMVKDLRKAALGYIQWKQSQSHFRKPWRYPEDITVPRILITDCWDPTEVVQTPSLPSTPTTQMKPSKIATIQSNGDSNQSSATNSPISQKKTKKKFKFKFDK